MENTKAPVLIFVNNLFGIESQMSIKKNLKKKLARFNFKKNAKIMLYSCFFIIIIFFFFFLKMDRILFN